MIESPVFTPEEAVAYLGLEKLKDKLRSDSPLKTLENYAERGMIEYIMIAGTRAYLQDQLDRFLQGLRHQAGKQVGHARTSRSKVGV